MQFPSDCWLRVASLKKKGRFLSHLHIHHKSPMKSTQLFYHSHSVLTMIKYPLSRTLLIVKAEGKRNIKQHNRFLRSQEDMKYVDSQNQNKSYGHRKMRVSLWWAGSSVKNCLLKLLLIPYQPFRNSTGNAWTQNLTTYHIILYHGPNLSHYYCSPGFLSGLLIDFPIFNLTPLWSIPNTLTNILLK